MTILEQLQSAFPDVEGIGDARNIAEALAMISGAGGRGANAIADKVSNPGGGEGGGIDAYAEYDFSEAIGSSASYVGSYAFGVCPNLITASFPNASSIGDYAFWNCSSLTTVSFPNASYIGDGAFEYCTNLISFYLTGGSLSQVPTLSEDAFYITPIGGYSDVASHYGSVYVPASLYSAFLSADNWSDIASRIVSVESESHDVE